jgi:hypothetical protein
MAGIKRKDVSEPAKSKTKKLKPSPAAAKSAVRPIKPTKKSVKRAPSVELESSESDTPEENGFVGFSEKERLDESSDNESMSLDGSDEEVALTVREKSKKAEPVKNFSATKKTNGTATSNNHLGDEGALGGMSMCHLTIDFC